MHQNRSISLFSTPFDHFHFHALTGLIWWVLLRSCPIDYGYKSSFGANNILTMHGTCRRLQGAWIYGLSLARPNCRHKIQPENTHQYTMNCTPNVTPPSKSNVIPSLDEHPYGSSRVCSEATWQGLTQVGMWPPAFIVYFHRCENVTKMWTLSVGWGLCDIFTAMDSLIIQGVFFTGTPLKS